MREKRKRFTYANVVATLALFLVVAGGSAFAASKLAKNSVGTNQLKKNSVTTAKIKKNAVNGAKVKNGSLTGSDINLGTLGTVPSAANAEHLSGFTQFTGHGPEDSLTPLYNDGQFEVVGICDENFTFDPPGFQFENIGSSIGIINRGQNGGWADTSDDEDAVFDIGEGVAFDYLDAGDGGSAVLPNGHEIFVFGGAITQPGENSNFGSDCTFRGMAWSR